MRIITNIGELCGIVPSGVLRKQGAEMDELATLKNAYLTVLEGKIDQFREQGCTLFDTER